MYKTLRGQTNGSFKTQTLLSQEYLVIPVVAMIEGVRFGANQDSAELGLASEFGHFVDQWNNRPIVLGHPRVDEEFVSAGSPAVMEVYAIGTTMNANVKNKKLKMEAWLNTALEEKSTESKRMFERVRNGDQIEVSVGFFTDLEESTGTYDSKEYTGIWRHIASDHLAFLEEGTIGACSIEDGCGAPRTNQTGDQTMSDKPKTLADKLKGYIKPNSTTAVEGGSAGTVKLQGLKVACKCTDNTAQRLLKNLKPQSTGLTNAQEIAQHSIMLRASIQNIIAQEIPDGLLNDDVESALADTLNDIYPYAYVMGFTQTMVIFQAYMGDGGWCLYQAAFDIDADGNVTFSGEPEEIRLITRIVPVGETDDAGGDVNTNATNSNTPKEGDMTNNANKTTAQTGAIGTGTAATTAVDANGGTAVNGGDVATTTGSAPLIQPVARTVADLVGNESKPVTVNDYLASAPVEIRDILSSAVTAQEQRRVALLTQIKKSGRCQLSEDFLKAQKMPELEAIAKMADVVAPNYSGVGAPVANMAVQEEVIPTTPKVCAVDPNFFNKKRVLRQEPAAANA